MPVPVIEISDDEQKIFSPFTGRMLYGQDLSDDQLEQVQELLGEPSLDPSILFMYDGENGEYSYTSSKLIEVLGSDPDEDELEPLVMLGQLELEGVVVMRQCNSSTLGDFWVAFAPIETI
ncbi:hypothetical protein A6E01_07905 [Vibrio breoganii]|uniref:Uncharacterized protein n=1 Tax=Vibrio breoganii TaxID=553239 RepID=A0AAN0XVA6_9VIBR|nr:hypothetical protein [Vibrio breoganii]ANO33137.1 hypothetical protein A6E01_07905 [Vibrio breoganii]